MDQEVILVTPGTVALMSIPELISLKADLKEAYGKAKKLYDKDVLKKAIFLVKREIKLQRRMQAIDEQMAKENTAYIKAHLHTRKQKNQQKRGKTMDYVDENTLVAHMRQLYETNDEERMDTFFTALADTFDSEALEECIQRAWGEY